jgi:putative hydroxymethylpyrimidine transport system substrate-binding protein
MGQPVYPGIRPLRSRTAAALGLLAAVATAATGCGGGDSTGTAAKDEGSTPLHWTLVLDYQPNAVHAGLARALQAGYFKEAGIALRVIAPSSTSDALTQVGRGKAEVGLADLIDASRRNDRAVQKASGDASDPVALVGAIVQEPLSGILVNAASSIKTPADLADKRIAVTGLPSDVAVVKAIVRQDGKGLATKQITLGFDGLKALDAGRVDGATAYWPADEVTLKQLGTTPRTFSLSEDGNVHYPGLVAFTTPAIARAHPGAVQAFQQALRHGTQDVIADPSVGEAALAAQYPELDPVTTKAQLANYRPLFGSDRTAGQLESASLQRFATFAADAGLTSHRLTPAELRGGTIGG